MNTVLHIAAVKLLIVAMLFFASCSPQKKVSKVTGGYTDEGTVLTDITLTDNFSSTAKKPKTKRHPSKYYVKNRSFFRSGVNGQLHLYKY